jgi:heme/copper-type cytochrome/quinol oxidase subunit 3
VKKPERVMVDVTELPTIVFGRRGLLWWGTWSFAVVESMTMLLSVASYFYLRRNFHSFPPEGFPKPDWIRPTIGVALFLLSLVPAYFLQAAARTLDRERTKRWLIVLASFAVILCGVRWSDYLALRVMWMASAYGSVTWVLLGFHASLIIIEAIEVIGACVLFIGGPVLPRHYPDACDVTNYWYFLVASWLPIWFIVFVLPQLG